MPYNTVVTKTIEYLSVPSVVGHEGHFLNYLHDDFEKLGLAVERHPGILEISGNAPQRQIISAHADRHGLISIGHGQYAYAAEYVKECKYDEVNRPSKATVKAISERFIGEEVLAYTPDNGDIIGRGIIEKSTLAEQGTIDSFFEITGMEHMPPDTPIAYARSAESDGDFLKGQIDNVVSLGVIYTLFQNGFNGTAIISAEEEIGKSWVHISNWLKHKNIETQDMIILDTSPYRETAPVDSNMIVLRNRDKSGVFNEILTQKIKQRCVDMLLPFQFKDEYFLSLGLKIEDLGSTELGRLVQENDHRWSGATVQIPTTEYHTSYETTSRGCIESFYALLQSILVTDPVV